MITLNGNNDYKEILNIGTPLIHVVHVPPKLNFPDQLFLMLPLLYLLSPQPAQCLKRYLYYQLYIHIYSNLASLVIMIGNFACAASSIRSNLSRFTSQLPWLRVEPRDQRRVAGHSITPTRYHQSLAQLSSSREAAEPPQSCINDCIFGGRPRFLLVGVGSSCSSNSSEVLGFVFPRGRPRGTGARNFKCSASRCAQLRSAGDNSAVKGMMCSVVTLKSF